MMQFSLELPFPPSVNHYWRHVIMPPGKKRKAPYVQALVSAEGRKYKSAVCADILRQKAAHGIATPVAVLVTLFPPDRRRRDVDNYAKALLDGMVEARVLEDDSLIRDLRLIWGAAIPGGKAVVTIREMACPPKQGVLV